MQDRLPRRGLFLTSFTWMYNVAPRRPDWVDPKRDTHPAEAVRCFFMLAGVRSLRHGGRCATFRHRAIGIGLLPQIERPSGTKAAFLIIAPLHLSFRAGVGGFAASGRTHRVPTARL